jgi:hypothetical protein
VAIVRLGAAAITLGFTFFGFLISRLPLSWPLAMTPPSNFELSCAIHRGMIAAGASSGQFLQQPARRQLRQGRPEADRVTLCWPAGNSEN